VLENSQRIDEVKGLLEKRERVEVTLDDMEVSMVFQVCVTGIDCARIVQRNDLCAGFDRDLCESTGTAPRIQNPLSTHCLGAPSRRFPESIGGNRKTGEAVELSLSELVPLESKIVSVIGGRHEARNEVAHGIALLAILRNKPTVTNATVDDFGRLQRERTARARTAQQWQ
jgi:hypothetical protein